MGLALAACGPASLPIAANATLSLSVPDGVCATVASAASAAAAVTAQPVLRGTSDSRRRERNGEDLSCSDALKSMVRAAPPPNQIVENASRIRQASQVPRGRLP